MDKTIKRAALIAAGAALVWLAKPSLPLLIAGCLPILLGMAVRVWAAGHLSRSTELTTSGPYAYLRDPLYLGRLLYILGFGMMAGGWGWVLMLAGLVVFFASYMPRKYKREMTRLEKRYGEEYTRYASQVRSLIPRLTRYPEARVRSWSFERCWRDNREQYLVLCIVALVGVFFYLYLRGRGA